MNRTSSFALSVVPVLSFFACGQEPPPEEPAVEEVQSALAGTWTSFTNTPPSGLGTCLVLTNGQVMCHESSTNRWHRLTPDSAGSYKNGTWDAPPIPPMPNGNDPSFNCVNCTYAPLYFASAVLTNGVVVVIGGEYNGTAGAV